MFVHRAAQGVMRLKAMLTFLRDLFATIIAGTLGILIYFGIPGLASAVIAIVLGIHPESGNWFILLLLVAAAWIFLLMNPPSWLERLIRWFE
jgi:hypothetical protein